MPTTGVFDTSLPPDSEVVALEAVAPLIEAMPAYWTHGSEKRWTEYAWGILEAEGLTAFDSPVDEVQVICRLLTLTAVLRAFSDVATGGHLDWEEAVGVGPEVVAERLDLIALGRLAEGFGLYSKFDGPESAADLAAVVAREEWEEVTAALRHGMGDAQLFGSLWMTRSADTRYPVADEALAGLTDEVTADRRKSFEWVVGGLPL